MASYLDSNSLLGTFVVGDGTKVGEQPVFYPDKSRLVLNGKAFVANLLAGDFVVAPFTVRPILTLTSKTLVVTDDSTALTGRPTLTLRGKSFVTMVPVTVVPGKASLTLTSRPYVLAISVVESFGKPALILKSKIIMAGEVALVPTIPSDISLIPSLPESLVLTAADEESLLLVPTVEEFR